MTHTGIAGLTVGGGLGWLMRKHGLTCDNLLACDVVTADGKLVRASPDEHADLFWSLQGGILSHVTGSAEVMRRAEASSRGPSVASSEGASRLSGSRAGRW